MTYGESKSKDDHRERIRRAIEYKRMVKDGIADGKHFRHKPYGKWCEDETVDGRGNGNTDK